MGKWVVSPQMSSNKRSLLTIQQNIFKKLSSKGGITIKDENRLWLANNYYQKVQECSASDISNHPEVTNAIDRASNHYQKLLMRDGHLVEMTADNLHLEREVVKLSKLLEYQRLLTSKLLISS